MKLTFYKYQGTGNDFVMLDNRSNIISKNDTNLVKHLCDRKFGVGADGLILLEKADTAQHDFKMVYFNADGNQSSMCGNGGRCIVAFAKFLGIITNKTTFSAIDGIHEAVIHEQQIGLKMTNVTEVFFKGEEVFLNTGSPHHVVFSERIEDLNIKKEGAAIRNSGEYKSQGGTNVNFVQPVSEATFKVRTYERGVEDETLSCGTGVTAVALAVYATGKTKQTAVQLDTPGGQLEVRFTPVENGFSDIWLTGPAKQVFKGEVDVNA